MFDFSTLVNKLHELIDLRTWKPTIGAAPQNRRRRTILWNLPKGLRSVRRLSTLFSEEGISRIVPETVLYLVTGDK